jgi:hypothetical protein
LLNQEISSRGITDPEAISLLEAKLRNDPAFQQKALDAFLASPEGKAYVPIFENKDKQQPTPQGFKAPEGFGNVVGVGANPVMEAMTMQLEESRKQTALLESINQSSNGGGVPTDFTKGQTTKTPAFSGR